MTSVSTLWRRLLIYTHRWLGIAGSVLFVVWFVSGVVLMYAGMPTLSSQERLRRAPVLDLSTARLGVSEAAVKAGFTPSRIVVGMHGDRPVYRLAGAGGWTTRLYHNPLVPWIWIGVLVMVLGGGVSLTDRRHRVGAPARARRHARTAAQPAE